MSTQRLLPIVRLSRPARRAISRRQASSVVEHGHGHSAGPQDVYTNESLLTPGTLGVVAAAIASVAYWQYSLSHAPAIAGSLTEDGKQIELDGEHYSSEAEDKRLPWLTRVFAYHLPAKAKPEMEPEEAAIHSMLPTLRFFDRGLADAQDNRTISSMPSHKVKRSIPDSAFFRGSSNGVTLPGERADLSDLVIVTEEAWPGRPKAPEENADDGDEQKDDE